MRIDRRVVGWVCAACATVLLSACGGGGSYDEPPAPQPAIDRAHSLELPAGSASSGT